MFLVAGSVHLDILSRVTGDELVTDKVGEVSMEIGGTGGNIALNLRNLGSDVRMLTAMNGSTHSKFILEHMQQAGVDLAVLTGLDLPLAAFVAHIDRNGELMSAISSMPVDKAQFDRGFMESAFGNADGKAIRAVVIDANLSSWDIYLLAKIGAERGVPVFVAGVSPEKAVRVADAVLRGARLAGLFMNRAEAEYVKARRFVEGLSDQDLSKRLETTVVITESGNGVFVSDASATVHHAAIKVLKRGHFLGAGDAFMASVIHGFVDEDLSLADASLLAMRSAAAAINRSHCNFGEGGAIERMMRNVHEKAHLDAMTSLLNRGSASERLQRMIVAALKNKESLAVILLDIDHFKSINDVFGHEAGDEVIAKMAEIIRSVLRGSDLAARWGGEEFLCVLPKTDSATALKVAERIRLAVEEKVITPRKTTASFGVAAVNHGLIAENSSDAAIAGVAKQLVAKADEALYASKNGGRNRVTVYGQCD